MDVRDVPLRARLFDAVPELLAAGLFDAELFAGVPLFFAVVLFPFRPPLDFDELLADVPLFDEVFAAPLFAAVPPVFFAAPADPDLAVRDFAVVDFAGLAFDALDFAVLDFDPEDLEAPAFADDDFAEPELLAAPFADAPVDRERDVEPFAAPPVPVTVSAAAPSAPTAAPVAAPPKISPATSITASITFAAVDVRRLVPLLAVFELEDVDRLLLFCLVFVLSGMMSSQVLVLNFSFSLNLTYYAAEVIQIFDTGL